MSVPPLVGSNSGISWNSGFRWTWGTRGLKSELKPLIRPKISNLQLVGARDRAVNGGVERGRVAAGGQDANAFHRLFAPFALLLLLLLLTSSPLFIVEMLENVGVEQRAADVVQLDLQLVQVLMQAAARKFPPRC